MGAGVTIEPPSGSLALMLPELAGNPRRQAVASIRGTVYQAWCSIDAWLQLNTADKIIYLEGAEDFDIVEADGAIAVQVKHNEASISLGTAKAKEALENFWELVTKEPTRQVDFHYLTTSSVANERDGIFGEIKGLDAWKAACTNVDMAVKVASYIKSRLEEGSSLRCFIESAGPDELQNRLFRRINWLTDQPGIDAVKQSVDDRIRVLLHHRKKSVSLASKVRVQLESRFWQVVLDEESSNRRLTFGDLLEQVELATTAYLPIPLDQLPDLLSGSRPGLGLLKLLINKVQKTPEPLIQRSELVRHLEESVNQRRLMLLTGTVFKGKSTIAQLVANNLCPDAWWVNLTDRRADQIDTVFLALAGEIESDKCPSLVIIDDLDISPAAHRAYRDSLALVLHRAKASGRAVLMTARGGTSDAAQLSEFPGIEIFSVPELTSEEVRQLCLQEGCPIGEAEFWALIVHAFSKGHPKLVQVRIAELAGRGWPSPTSTDFGLTSSAADSVRQRARRLLTDSCAPEVAEFLYCASESTVLLHRSVAIKLAEKIGGIRNPGDLLDGQAGQWLECLENDWFRTTPILQGAAGDVWTENRRALAHIHIHDSISSKQTLDPSEAAALLYHAYFGKEPGRIAHAALKLQLIENTDARDAVERSLLWLPYVALDVGQPLCEDPVASSTLRSLQFRVAVTLDSDILPIIGARWAEEVAQVLPEQTEVLATQLRQGMENMLWTSLAMANTKKLPLGIRLDAIRDLSNQELTGDLAEVADAGMRSFFASNDAKSGIPPSGTSTQVLLALSTRWVRDAPALRELVEWLDRSATDEVRNEFESILTWPLVQTMGAFVHGAWSAEHANVTDWGPWLELFDFIENYAKRRASPTLGREAAKAKAIILTEYLSRSDDALLVISSAEASFGESAVLAEQRANVLFHAEDDEQVLEIWDELVENPSNKYTLDPFAYRRAAISAARLARWDKAAGIFKDAISSIDPETFGWTRFGLKVDCALATCLGGKPLKAAELLADAVSSLPESAAEEGDERWEASQRAASEVCVHIENSIWKPSGIEPKFQPGYASSPDLRVEKSEPGQALRTALLRAQTAKLCTCLGVSIHFLDAPEIASLRLSEYPFVRWQAAKAHLARSFSTGAGRDFIPAIREVDATTSTFLRLGQASVREKSPLEADEPTDINRWTGFLAAGICCAGTRASAHIEMWRSACDAEPEVFGHFGETVRQLQTGVELPTEKLRSVAADNSSSFGVRCGAALKLMSGTLAPEELLSLQGFVASALVSDASFTIQEVCNRHLALQFANSWEEVVERPFSLPSPRTTVSELQAAVLEVKEGKGTLRSLLLSVASAMGQPSGQFLDRVW